MRSRMTIVALCLVWPGVGCEIDSATTTFVEADAATAAGMDTAQVSVTPAAEEELPYFSDGEFVAAAAKANLIRRYEFPTELDGRAIGFDLDGRVSGADDTQTCGQGDLSDLAGTPGVDNQLAKMWFAIEPIVGEAVAGLLQGSINEGRFLLVVELGGLDDLVNDDDVTLNLFRGRLDPIIGTSGLIAPGQTVAIDAEFGHSTVEHVKLQDGKLEAGPVAFQLPIDILEADFVMHIFDGRIRLQVHEDGTFSGELGGAIEVQAVMDELLATDAAAEAALVAPIFQDNADMGFEDGACRHFSVAFGFEGTTTFVRRDADSPL